MGAENREARTFLSLANILTSSELTNQLDKDKLRYLRKNLGYEFTTLGNILGLLLCYVPAVGVTLVKIAYIIESITASDFSNEVSDDFESIEFFESNQIDLDDSLTFQTAHDIVNDIRSSSLGYGFNIANTMRDDLVFLFVKAKLLKLSAYIKNFERFDPFFEILSDSQEFRQWQQGVIMPYIYYSQSQGDSVCAYDEYVNSSFSVQFSYLVSPLSRHNCIDWLTMVLLPFIEYHRFDFEPLREFLFTGDKDLANSYEIWGVTISTIAQRSDIPEEKYQHLIKWYLGSCYYYFFYGKDLHSVEMMRVYDSIRNCINSIQSNSNGTDDLDIKVPESFDTPIPLDSFIENSSSSLELLFVPSSSSLLLDILSVCEKLYPTTKISIRDYFQLKYTLNFDQREKKAMKIMNGLNEANWEIVLNSLEIYSDAFMTLSDPDPQFSQLIINRFLLVNLFHVVNQLYKSHRLPLDVNTYCRCLLSKFWDLFNNSANLNEKIGKLHSAVQIIPLFDNITSDESLSSEKKTEIIQIKHLLKAISNMKNFKIVVERGVPVTPNQIFKKFTTLSSDTNSPTDLISLILEQNPKSYLAYEKLYRILNDLILATPIMEDTKTPTTDRSSNQIARLKSVCIESALIDNNFQFAYSKSIELFEHCSNEEILSKTWLTIFQVGKYISPSWYEEESTGISDKIEILLKQREILSMLLKIGKGSSSDNSKLIINQISKLNGEINEWYQDETNSTIQPTHKRENVAFGSIANEIVHDATNTTHQASEKLSNLFVSGLGWAIGANP